MGASFWERTSGCMVKTRDCRICGNRGRAAARRYRPATSNFLHLDEARRAALDALEKLTDHEPEGTRAVLIDDLFGGLRVALWPARDVGVAELVALVDKELRACAGTAWSGKVWVEHKEASAADKLVLDAAWTQSAPYTERLRILDRVRNRTAWFEPPGDPPWRLQAETGEGDAGPPIVAFCSFKGGVGRATGLAAFALSPARIGERVVVVDLDLDLDALGISTLFDLGDKGARWGVVDYLLERARGAVPLADTCMSWLRTSLASCGALARARAGGCADHWGPRVG